MFKSAWQIITLVLIISVLVMIQNSFIGALNNSFRHFNLLLSVLILILFFLDLRLTLLSAFIAGLFLDSLSFNFFGLYTSIFFLSTLMARYILKNWLTNRSFYTLVVLLFASVLFYNLMSILFLYLTGASADLSLLWQSHFWRALGYQLIWSGLFALVTFNLAAAASKKIKPFFLETKSLYDEF